MKLDTLFPEPESCAPLVVTTWVTEEGILKAVPVHCTYHEWIKVGPNILLRLVGENEQRCSVCDACESDRCQACMETVCEQRGIRVILRKCTVAPS